MKNKLSKQWLLNLEKVDVAFQPIVNIHTGKIFAVEALLRNHKDIGFKSIFDLFDYVYDENILYSFDLALREKAFLKFTQIENYEQMKLFYNLDNRLFEMEDYSTGNTDKILKKLNIKKENLCFEISERHDISDRNNLERLLQHYKNDKYAIAIDDFGVGYSGYKLLYDSTPDFIKIDRFFLEFIEKNPKKKMLVRSITHLAIQLGITVIAEGVETKKELLTCKEIGCHLVQGYFVEHPTKKTEEILQKYTHIEDCVKSDRRTNLNDKIIEKQIDKIVPLNIKDDMNVVVKYFKKNKNIPIIPVVNTISEALGIINENQIKEFLYSPYGISLLLNDESKSKLKNLLSICGNTDINSSLSTIIELFSNNPDSVGIIITQNTKYYGFLSARAIISIMHEENILSARDQNPLTKLPGNSVIETYMQKMIDANDTYILCYFDLDNFKAFNDVYGFRNGDRVIQLFADILKKELNNDAFKAHIGGDDFFVGFHNQKVNYDTHINYITTIIDSFKMNAEEFYSKEDKSRGYIISKDRDEKEKKFPLLSVSASVINIEKKITNKNLENINNILASQKKVAKNSVCKIAISSLI